MRKISATFTATLLLIASGALTPTPARAVSVDFAESFMGGTLTNAANWVSGKVGTSDSAMPSGSSMISLGYALGTYGAYLTGLMLRALAT